VWQHAWCDIKKKYQDIDVQQNLNVRSGISLGILMRDFMKRR
jgi:hypothetical protein